MHSAQTKINPAGNECINWQIQEKQKKIYKICNRDLPTGPTCHHTFTTLTDAKLQTLDVIIEINLYLVTYYKQLFEIFHRSWDFWWGVENIRRDNLAPVFFCYHTKCLATATKTQPVHLSPIISTFSYI